MLTHFDSVIKYYRFDLPSDFYDAPPPQNWIINKIYKSGRISRTGGLSFINVIYLDLSRQARYVMLRPWFL
jgi:hypothetical protein